jgi:hypothetical protein
VECYKTPHMTVCWFSVKWREGLAVSEYSASLNGPSCRPERKGDWHEEAGDGSCNWFQKEIRLCHNRCTWCTGQRDRWAPCRRHAGVDGRGSYSKRNTNWLGKKNLESGVRGVFQADDGRFRCPSGLWHAGLGRFNFRVARKPPGAIPYEHIGSRLLAHIECFRIRVSSRS